MKNIFVYILLILSVACQNSNQEKGSPKKVIIGYIMAGNALINENEIAVEKLTHINFAFANIVNGEIAEGSATDSANYTILNRLKKRNPDLKILVSVGGWSWSDNFSEMASNQENRKKFIESSIRFAEKHQLDGIDLDWEYPGLPGEGNPFKQEDKQNFSSLLQEFRQALDDLGKTNNKHYLLTIAAAAFQEYVDNIEPEKIYPVLDYINLMTYDFCGEWDTITGHLTNLYMPQLKPEASSCDKTVELFLKAGVPAEKMVLGMAFYGRGWRNVSASDNGLYGKGKGYNPGYSFKSINEKYLGKNGYVRYFDSSAKAPFIYNADSLIFITYEDPESIKYKCEYINHKNLAGAMFWQYNGDYKEQLLDAINAGFK